MSQTPIERVARFVHRITTPAPGKPHPRVLRSELLLVGIAIPAAIVLLIVLPAGPVTFP